MSGDVQVRFCESLGVRFPQATLLLFAVMMPLWCAMGVQSNRVFIFRRA